jgi:hypothetical protein
MKMTTSSFSLSSETLEELKTLAGERGVSVSRLVQAGIETFLRDQRAAALEGEEPLVTLSPRRIERPWPTVDATFRRQLADSNRPAPARPRPRPYNVGGAFLDFESKPLRPEMVEQLRSDVERRVALLWIEDAERNEAGP